MDSGYMAHGRVEGDSRRVDNADKRKLHKLTAISGGVCAFVGCELPAEYHAEFMGGSYALVCPMHATELSRRAGWPDA